MQAIDGMRSFTPDSQPCRPLHLSRFPLTSTILSPCRPGALIFLDFQIWVDGYVLKYRFHSILNLKGSPIIICRRQRRVSTRNYARQDLHFLRGLGLLHTRIAGTV